MKCFNHQDREAVAVCRSCGKAVCHDCSIKTEEGISCQQSCTAALLNKKELYLKQVDHLKNIKRMNLFGSFFSIGVGILFIYFSSQGFGLVYDFIFLLGAGFTVYGIVALLANVIIFFKNKKNPHS